MRCQLVETYSKSCAGLEHLTSKDVTWYKITDRTLVCVISENDTEHVASVTLKKDGVVREMDFRKSFLLAARP